MPFALTFIVNTPVFSLYCAPTPMSLSFSINDLIVSSLLILRPRSIPSTFTVISPGLTPRFSSFESSAAVVVSIIVV